MPHDEEKPFLNQDHQPEYAQDTSIHKCRDRNLVVLPWIIAAVSWLITIYIVVSQGEALSHDLPQSATSSKDTTTTTPASSSPTTGGNQPFINHFPTDLEAMRRAITYERRTFTGALLYNETTQRFYLNSTDSEPAFVGPPSPAIDAAWETLLYEEWTPLTESEAAPYTPDLKPWGDHYRFEPDVFHSLHCLNEIRKRIDVEYYSRPEHAGFKIEQEDWDRIHIDHCLDQMRQTVLCFGDLSPVPLYSWKGAPLGLGKGTEHTCRKWEPIRDWVDQRQLEMKGS